MSLTLRPIGKGDVSVGSITDPTGQSARALFLALATKKGVTTLKKLAFTGPSGRYTVSVATPSTTVKYRLDITVLPLPRAKGKAKLTGMEPRLAPMPEPLRIADSFAATLHGHDFSAEPPVRVSDDSREPSGTSRRTARPSPSWCPVS